MSRLSKTLIVRTTPSTLRSAGTKPIPAAIAAVGSSVRTPRRRSRSCPRPSAGPNISSKQLAAAGAGEPGDADDLPRQDLERHRLDAGADRRPRPRPGGGASVRPIAGGPFGGRLLRLADHVVDDPVGRVVADRAGADGRPSRSTVTSSAIANSSGRRWETNIVATPLVERSRTAAKRRSTSSRLRKLVGSSRIRTRASIETARAISTICRWSGRSWSTGSSTS